jgi:hypothetical protein
VVKGVIRIGVRMRELGRQSPATNLKVDPCRHDIRRWPADCW